MKHRTALARVDDESRKHKIDIARDIIYKKNYAVNSKPVENFLKEQSLTPTSVRRTSYLFQLWAEAGHQNAFSERLSPLGFNMFLMLLVDLLHEFELGVWKAVFIHLLRMLHATDPTLVHELDRRYVSYLVIFIFI
jgi:hypothetical protein